MRMSTHRKSALSLALLLSAGCLAHASPLADSAAGRQDFIAAMQRIRMHQPDTPDSPALEAYAIHDYLVVARLRRDLLLGADESLDSNIDAFLKTHAGQPVARGLRRDWLLNLAQRRRWDWFLPRSLEVADPVLVCDRLQGRLTLGDLQGLAAAALVRWIAPQQPPAECSGVFAWLRQQGLLTQALAQSRARAALAADNPRLAREFAADVSLNSRAALLQWSDLLQSPAIALRVLATHPSLTVEPEALAAGFDKLSRTEPAVALDMLPRILARDGMTPALEAELQRSAALGAAYDHDARAIAIFNALPQEAVDGQVQEWRARSALWSEDYARVLAWTEQMSPALATLPRWRYWHARAVSQVRGEAAAAPLYGELAALRDYYGYLAADRLHQKYSLNVQSSQLDPAAQSALASEPSMIRAHELFDCDLTEEAIAEWTFSLEGADAASKIQAALLANSWGWYAQAITTLAQSGDFDDVNLRYPRPYQTEVAAASKLAQVPQDWILAVMRQESLFRRDAVSRADARGLMQMLPATASAIARRWHIAFPGRDSLFDPSVAVPLGAVHLRELLDHYGEQLILSLAAYNAGSAAIAHWMPTQTTDADVWIENIPYNETRGYVQHILEHIVAYAAMRGAAPPRLNVLLSDVEPAVPFL
ncbi:MAG TPA: transglycosylase SLT domain-containing protein [Steroidobacteraceae bacterium]|jgi:soluble lytic murein transglycosylase